MADKTISELVAATAVQSSDLFVLEQSGTAKKLTGQILENWLVSYADGHGGIQSIAKTSTSGTNPVVDTYTITLADTTTATFTVTNGLKGDTGAQTYVWIKYAATQPTQNSDMGDTPDSWMGIYCGTTSSAPSSYTSYTWYKIKGDTGENANISSRTIRYQQTASQVQPEQGDTNWSTTMPTLASGKYLWTQTQTIWNTGSVFYTYECTRNGLDGSGSVVTVNNQNPDNNGNVTLTASDINASDSSSIQSHLTTIETAEANKILYFTNVSCTATTGNFASLSDSRITSDHVVLECVFDNPVFIITDVTWTTANGSLTLNGTCTASTTAKIVLGKKNN